MTQMASWLRLLRGHIDNFINGDTKPMSASQKCEFLMVAYQRKRVTLIGVFSFIISLNIAFLLIGVGSYDFESGIMSSAYRTHQKAVFSTRIVMIVLLASFVALLMCCHPVSKEEEKLMHSVLFDHHLERDSDASQCPVIQNCFHYHAQHCESQFTPHQIAFMRIMCLSSLLHGTEISISSTRTRGLMQLLFMRLWPMSAHQKEVVLNVIRAISRFQLRDRLFIYMRVAANTSSMELTALMSLVVYAHTILSDGVVVSNWNGVYSGDTRDWNFSRGQDPRYISDIIYLMSDCLLASLCLTALFPFPVFASLIVMLPVAAVVQVAFMTLPEGIRLYFLQQFIPGLGVEQLWILVSLFVLQRHNLFLLRIHRKDYLLSSRRRMNFLPQGDGNAPFAPAQDRMLVLAENLLTQFWRDDDNSRHPRSKERVPVDFLKHSASTASAPTAESARVQACAAISTLVRYLKDAKQTSSQVCNLSEICKSAVLTCQPLLKEHSVVLNFVGRQRSLPLRVLLVDDQTLVLKGLQRLARNRGYHYECCSNLESSVKSFEASLKCNAKACSRFDLILMDKEMPVSEQNVKDIDRMAGVVAVRRIRELSLLQAEQEPGFRCPCIIGNTACGDEDDLTLIQFRNELELARQQSGLPNNLLVQQGEISSWSDEFDREVRQLCRIDDALPPETDEAWQEPTVWGNPIRLQMIFYNLMTNAIVHGKPVEGAHRVCVSYDLIDGHARMHPCLMRSDRDDEVLRSMSWQLSGAFEDSTQRFVQVIVKDNGEGIDVNNERMRRSLRLQQPSVSISGSASPGAAECGSVPMPSSSVSNLGIGLQRVVCPEVANCHGAMGVHSRSEPDTGCSFVVALPYCSLAPSTADARTQRIL